VLVEGNHQRNRFMLPGVGDGLPDDLLMPEVHAVKEADGQADLASGWLQFVRGVDDAHGSCQSYIGYMVAWVT
jgi:hypothetical protein